MKSRISKLSPEIEKHIEETIEEQIKIERGWMAHAILLIAVWTMASEYGWGSKRLSRFYEQLIGSFNYLTDGYGYDSWYDKIISDLRRCGCDVQDEGFTLAREERKAKSQHIARTFTPEQQVRLQLMQEQMGGSTTPWRK